MTPAPANLRRRFLSWDRPLLPQAVEGLAENWPGDGPFDLADTLVLVPTRQTGRRLREALAAHAAERGQAVFPPRVLTLETYVAESVPAGGAATRLESQFAWVRVLREAALEEFRAVLPVDPPERNFAWALRLAADLARLQDALAEVGLGFADVPERVGRQFPEYERWWQLAELERRQAAALAAIGLRDAAAARLTGFDEAPAPAGVARIVVLAAPDPRPVALTLLARHAAQVPVEVWVFAPEGEAAAFDDWGRPEPEHWAQRPLLADDFKGRVTLCADPEAQAKRAADIAQSYADDAGLLAVGVLDAEIMPLLEGALRERDLAAYNPAGRARRGDRLHQLLTALGDLAEDDSFANVSALARHPDVLHALGAKSGAGFSAAGFLAALDQLQARHLPADLAAARRYWRGGDELEHIAAWRRRMRRGRFPENAAAVLADVFAGRVFDPRQPGEAALADAAGVWAETVGEVVAARERFPELSAAEAWESALRLYGGSMDFPDKPAGALELQGWLELMWEDAPHLVVTGLNDGLVPSAVSGDPFLPESLRELLGLKTNAMRLATDAYYLQALAASRARGGRLDLLLGRVSTAGEPLRPSRLLLHCADADLPARVDWLFRELPASAANLAWTRAWQLRPRQVAAPSRLAVTALRAWLNCPFRFYLSHGLKMAAVDPAKAELDALDFGILCHTALEAMGRDAAMRDCTDAGKLCGFLLEALELAAERQFGRELSLPLLVQMESARQRLGFAAETQARVRAEGWVIERVEWQFELPAGAFTLAGKIDRIDRHEATGEIRLLDYKTSDRPVNPAEAHLRAARRGEELREWSVWAGADKPRVWRDLQLPVYERAAAGLFPGARLTCGYFNLPKAVTETGIALWENYTPELAASAWHCVEGVLAAIARREFWPPRELSGREAEYDEFAPLFQRGAAESVAWPEGETS